jgi:chromosome segregation ATPase
VDSKYKNIEEENEINKNLITAMKNDLQEERENNNNLKQMIDEKDEEIMHVKNEMEDMKKLIEELYTNQEEAMDVEVGGQRTSGSSSEHENAIRDLKRKIEVVCMCIYKYSYGISCKNSYTSLYVYAYMNSKIYVFMYITRVDSYFCTNLYLYE